MLNTKGVTPQLPDLPAGGQDEAARGAPGLKTLLENDQLRAEVCRGDAFQGWSKVVVVATNAAIVEGGGGRGGRRG